LIIFSLSLRYWEPSIIRSAAYLTRILGAVLGLVIKGAIVGAALVGVAIRGAGQKVTHCTATAVVKV